MFRLSCSSRGASLCAVVLLALVAAACGGDSSPTAPSQPSAPYSQTDLRVGTGLEATPGRRATVNYSLWLYNPSGTDGKGTHVQSSTTPFTFLLGAREVITGWDQGVAGMRVGGLRRLVVPSNLAYGAAGRPPEIPGNATLVFDIELVGVQ